MLGIVSCLIDNSRWSYAKSHRESAITATLRDLAVFGKKKKRKFPGRMKKINTDCDPGV